MHPEIALGYTQFSSFRVSRYPATNLEGDHPLDTVGEREPYKPYNALEHLVYSILPEPR
jgi:hypothetical protein